jgi:transcriptional regulator GlxA family with amidase domain
LDPLVARFETWARERLEEGFSLDAAASALATSKRTLARRLREVLGKAPLSYFQDLRVQRAVHLLKTTDQDIERIAAQVGYADGVTLRSLLRRRLGQGIREIRGGPSSRQSGF